MPTLRFEGHSDDTFGETAVFHDDFDCCANGKPIVWEVKAGDQGLMVWGQYNGRDWPKEAPGAWMIGVQPLDADCAATGRECAPLPDWAIRFANGQRDYSPALLIDAPEGVVLRCLNRARD